MSEQEKATPQVSAIDDTQTKKTIRLRPVLAKAAPVINPAPAAVNPAPVTIKPAEPATDSPSDTRTRKTIKLKPLMPKVASTNRTVDPLAIPKPSTSSFDGSETKTRRSIPLGAIKPAVAPAPIEIAKPNAPETGDADDDRTVKVKRPAIVKPAEAAPRPAFKFNRPAAPQSAPGVAPVMAVKPAPAPVKPVDVDDAIESDDYDEEPEKLQVALSVVAAVALLASSAMLALTYFSIGL